MKIFLALAPSDRGARRTFFHGVAAAVLAAAAGFFPRAHAAESPAPVPLPCAHAHNDYEHGRPLLDALDHGFCNVEADVWLVGGRLLVAHDRASVRPERTLEALYLDPLRARVRANGGRVFRGGPEFTLLIDVKSEAAATYAALDPVLRRYAEMLTVFRGDTVQRGAIAIVISGNRARAEMLRQAERFAACDGRAADLDSAAPAGFIPWVSENWRTLSAWDWSGPMPEADRARLHDWVQRAHAQGRKLRFWNVPDRPETWRLLSAAGVDLLGTDDLAGLATFVRTSTARRD
jgi:hypothetical protein